MLYTKPKGMKYTDLCIFFDDNFWREDETYDEVKCYQYLYCITYMVALKKKLLRLYSDYDSFVMYATTTVYMRMLKKKRRGADRVKSILNYMKSSVGFLKIHWQQQEYTQQIDGERDERVDIEALKNVLRKNVSAQYSHQITNAVIDSFKEIPEIIKETIQWSPYKNDKIMMRNIELSCLITMYKSFMINKKTLKKIKSSNDLNVNLFNINKDSSITLFRLDETMHDTVVLLCNKIRKTISEKISKEISENTLDNNVLDDILETAWEATNHQLNSDNIDWEENN